MRFQSADAARFGWALACSLLLHFLLLWSLPPVSAAASKAQPLVASVRPPAAEEAVSERAAATPPRPLRRPVPALATPVPTPAATPPAPEDHPSDSTAASKTRSEAGAVASAPAPVAVSPPLPPPAEGLDGEGVRAYRLALAREARRFKRYPPQAAEAGWAGTTELRVSVAVGGRAQEVELVRSSGHAVLDNAALEMLRRALPIAAVPESLRGLAFAVSLPVVFEPPVD